MSKHVLDVYRKGAREGGGISSHLQSPCVGIKMIRLKL